MVRISLAFRTDDFPWKPFYSFPLAKESNIYYFIFVKKQAVADSPRRGLFLWRMLEGREFAVNRKTGPLHG
jgi:hypothetical protein